MSRSRGPCPGHILVADFNRAVARFFKPGNGAQQGGLAAARRPNQHREFARRHFKVDALHRMEAAVILVKPGDFQI